MPADNTKIQNQLPGNISEFIVHFMRAISSARLYASGHALLKKQTEQLYQKLQEAVAGRDFLFLGCARDALFMEGDFYQSKDASLQKFLDFFHSLGLSHMILDKEITAEELERFVGLLAGAQQGQGADVSAALPREKIKRARLGLLDYSVFSTVQTVAAQLAPTTEDEAIWRQLILLPATTAGIHLSPEESEQIARIAADVEGLKKLLLQMDKDMKEAQEGLPVNQRGAVLSNFLQNISETLGRISEDQKRQFARHVSMVFNSLEPQLRTQILGAVPPNERRDEKGGVIHEIFQDMPDDSVVELLVDALKEAGAHSFCFNNLFNRALQKYKEPGLLLALVRKKIEHATLEGKVDPHWEHLEQLLVQKQETEELNRQYQNEIEALATSIQIQTPMVEEDEKARLLSTLEPAFLNKEKARLILDIISQPHASRQAGLLPSLVGHMGGIFQYYWNQGDFLTIGALVRQIYLGLRDHPQQDLLRKDISALLSSGQIRELMKALLAKCRNYEPRETAALNCICQLYPEKAGIFLIDVFVESGDDDGPRSRWLSAAIAGLSQKLTKPLSQKLHDPTEEALPRLLTLAARCGDPQLAGRVEKFLDHRNHEIRLAVIGTLGKLKAVHAVPRLAEIILQKAWITTKKTKSLQMACARALAEIGTEEAREVLREVAGQGSGEVQSLCQELL